jgi:hypothetical protein
MATTRITMAFLTVGKNVSRGRHFWIWMLSIFLVLPLFTPPLAQAGRINPVFSLTSPADGPTPTDLFTVADTTQLTGRRVNLPLPACTARPSDCADLEVINTLDGFNLQPRLAIRFSGAIDPTSVIGVSSVVLVNLGNVRTGSAPSRRVIRVNQLVWEPTTNTLYAESDELLDQHTRYALLVTRHVRDRHGLSIKASKAFRRFLNGSDPALGQNPNLAQYRQHVLTAINTAFFRGSDIAAASVFTTQSTTAVLEKIRDQIKADTPDPADFLLGPGGSRTVFPLGTVTGLTFNRQVSTTPTFDMPQVFLSALHAVPGAVGNIAFGKYRSPNYENADQYFPSIGTRTGVPVVQSENDIYFNLFLPAGTKPANGWPVAIFGHGFGDNKNGGPLLGAAVLAASGIATITINVVGHGGGPLGMLTVNQLSGASTTFLAGGRGIDQNGDGSIDSTEGVNAALVKGIIASRDGLRQTTVDLMQLVRAIQVGMDVDGDGTADLDDARMYYFGQSFGGIYGTIFLGVEPDVRVGVPNVPGGAIIEIARLSPVFRPLVGLALAFRVPRLDNLPSTTLPGGVTIFNFNENLPLRNQFPVVNTVSGALPIQEFLEQAEWVSQAGNPVVYAPHLRKQPLDGVPAKTVIYQFARGDQTVPNPTTTAILRAGNLADRATFFRNDLAFALNSTFPKNPHVFLLNLDPTRPAVAGVALAAQAQIATFFASDGATVIDPDGLAPLFETPIVPPLPEDLGYIP